MKFAYADPPYLGQCKLYDHHHPDGRCWDDLETHRLLIERLAGEYPDGWALSASSPSLRWLWPLTPDDTRVAAWMKPFASFKPGVRVAYTWEPVMFRNSRPGSDRQELTIPDHLAQVIILRRGLTGAKPVRFCRWVADLLGFADGDTLDDLFPGTGVMDAVLRQGDLLGGSA